QPLVLFYYARAAAIDPPNSAKYMASFTKNYKVYHGSDEGMDDVVAMEKADKEAGENAANPAMGVWKTVKTGLTGDGSDQFFEGSAKTALLPGKDPSGQEMKWKAKI